jgi:hypothetical protein
VHTQRFADLVREILLATARAGLLELLEPLFDLAVILLEQRNRILLFVADALALFVFLAFR